jgi:hypothetical protein
VATHRFPCPSCGKTLKIDGAILAEARRRGRGMHCPTCKKQAAPAAVPERSAYPQPPPPLL